jgi:hypothetical protein
MTTLPVHLLAFELAHPQAELPRFAEKCDQLAGQQETPWQPWNYGFRWPLVRRLRQRRQNGLAGRQLSHSA